VSAETFRTFCHISEYGNEGYERLDQLVAASAPLVLWAPSSAIINSPICPLSGQDFVHLVSEGRIRVLGRSDWFEKGFRDHHPWAGARWVPEIDEPLQRLRNLYDTPGIARSERPVANSDTEYGTTWAANFYATHPAKMSELRAAFRAPDMADHFPSGVVESAHRGKDEDDALHLLLRDAYNHHAALRNADTSRPFLLAKREARFTLLMEEVLAEVPGQVSEPSEKHLSAPDLVSLTRELLDILGRFDTIRTQPVTSFVRSQGHELLTTWLRGIYDHLLALGATDAQGHLLGEMRKHMADGGTDIDWKNVLLGLWGTGLMDTGVSIAGFVDSSREILDYVGLGLGAIPVGYELAKQLSLAPTRFQGNPWPFLYAFGGRPNRRRYGMVARALL